ncbi:MAG: ATP-binding protein [Pseudobdellovibrionaceae bacterium]
MDELSAKSDMEACRENLLQLAYLRWLAISGSATTILAVHFMLDIPLPLEKMLGVTAFQIISNLYIHIRYFYRHRITNNELFSQLLVDVAAFTAQIYLSGGASNPFVSLFLLQVTIGAVLLPPILTWILTSITTLCYIFISIYYVPVSSLEHHHGSSFQLHIIGMHVAYLLASCLLVFFISRIRSNLADRNKKLESFKRQAIEEDHIIRFGLLAAGAAHELGTPLSTISVILKDWEILGIPPSEETQKDIASILGEIERCKDIVNGIIVSSGDVRGESASLSTISAFLDGVFSSWKISRGPALAIYNMSVEDDYLIVVDKVLERVLFNVFDNALEASPDWVDVDITAKNGTLTIIVRDFGIGFPQDILEKLGSPYTSTKSGSGRGLGLFLVITTIRKLGGKTTIRNYDQGGAEVVISLPLESLRIKE